METPPAGTFQFTCVPGCTNCCNQKGYVFLTEQDLVNAAEFVGMTPRDFERRYVYRNPRILRFKKPTDRQCPFLTDTGCSIHPVKPTQCRLFPYWPELVEVADGWTTAAQYCPGIGQGPLIQIGTAVEMAQEMKTAYPFDYED